MKKILVLIAGLLVLGVAVGWAAVPLKINYEGRLTDIAGSALTGSYNMRFSITSDLAGSTVVWGPESHTGVAVSKGVFAVNLGDTTPITTAELSSDTRYLKIEIANPADSTTAFETLTPHSQVVSVAYAIKSQQADNVTGGYVSKLIAGTNITLSGQQGDVTISAAGGGGAGSPPDNVTIGLNGSSSLEVKDGGINGTKLAGNISINTTGVITASAFSGSGSGLTGIVATNATSLDGQPASYYAPVSALATFETATHAAAIYITNAALGTFETISHAADTYAAKSELSTFETVSHAAATYVPNTSMSTFETKANATATYATKTELTTFETKANAAATYATLAALATFETASHAAGTYAAITDLAAHATDTSTHGVTSDLVGKDDVQTLTNKTFTGTTTMGAVKVTSITGDGSGLSGVLSESVLAAHATATATHGATGNIVGTSDTQTLSNKTFTGTTTMAAVSVTSISGNGSGLTNLNAVTSLAKQSDARLTGAVDLKAGTNITLNQSGNTIEVVASGGSGSVTHVGSGAGLFGGPITLTGTLEVKYNNSTIGLNGSGSLEVKAGSIGTTQLASNLSISTTGTISAGAITATSTIESANCMFTPEGGFAVRLLNKTGLTSQKGWVVASTTEVTAAMGVMKSPLGSDRPIGVIYQGGVPADSYMWVVVDGIAEVLLDNNDATIGYFLMTSGDSTGTARAKTDPSSTQEHNREIGHCLTGGALTANTLIKAIIHFN